MSKINTCKRIKAYFNNKFVTHRILTYEYNKISKNYHIAQPLTLPPTPS